MMIYVLENVNAKGHYLADDIDTAMESELESGDVLSAKDAMQFKNVQELMIWSADAGIHKANMKIKFGEDALITLDIQDVLNNYKPLLMWVKL